MFHWSVNYRSKEYGSENSFCKNDRHRLVATYYYWRNKLVWKHQLRFSSVAPEKAERREGIKSHPTYLNFFDHQSMAVRGWAHLVDRDVGTGEFWCSLSHFCPYMYDIVLICPSFSAEKCPLCLRGHIVSVIRLSVVILFEDCYFRSGMTFVEIVERILGFQVFLVAIQKLRHRKIWNFSLLFLVTICH